MFEQDFFSEKFLILDYSGLSVKEWCLGAFLQNGSKDLHIFCMSVEDNRAHCLSKFFFQEKFLIRNYRGLSVQKGVFLLLQPLLQNSSKDLPNFLHECRGQ